MVFGAVLAFQAYSYASGQTFRFLRFYIVADPVRGVPGDARGTRGAVRATTRGEAVTRPRRQPDSRPGRRAAYVPVAVVFAIGVPVGGVGDEPAACTRHRSSRSGRCSRPTPTTSVQRKAVEHRIAADFSTEREIATYLDDLDLPESSVITDTVYGFAVVVASRKPKTFVVPSDPDFITLLNDPAAYGIKYLLAVPTPAAASLTR